MDVSAWSALLESLASVCHADAAGLAVKAITSPGPLRVGLEEITLKVLLAIAAKAPDVVMNAVGQSLLRPSQQRLFFGFLHFPVLLEAIGLQETEK